MNRSSAIAGRIVWVLNLAILGGSASAGTVDFPWALVGNPGNAPEPRTLRGDVAYHYAISKTEVTNAQYTQFLNAVAASDPHHLYSEEMSIFSWGGIVRRGEPGSYRYEVKTPAGFAGPGGTSYAYEQKPVVYVSFTSALRFTNWLHNGQGVAGTPEGETETGAYVLSDGLTETRQEGAKFWIPSADEWYKAAYHNALAGAAGNYFNYATRSNTAPNNNLPSADSGNSANYFTNNFATYSYFYPLTDVGAYSRSASPYGTFDQSGNVWEWTEEVAFEHRRLSGGSWLNQAFSMTPTSSSSGPPSEGRLEGGFRVATVPEANHAMTAALAALCLISWKRTASNSFKDAATRTNT